MLEVLLEKAHGGHEKTTRRAPLSRWTLLGKAESFAGGRGPVYVQNEAPSAGIAARWWVEVRTFRGAQTTG